MCSVSLSCYFWDRFGPTAVQGVCQLLYEVMEVYVSRIMEYTEFARSSIFNIACICYEPAVEIFYDASDSGVNLLFADLSC